MKILAISHLFPHENERRYGVFVARQLRAMYEVGTEITVLVPYVYCPRILSRLKRWRKYSLAPTLIQYEGLKVIAVPYLRIPGNWFNRWSGIALYHSMKDVVLRLQEQESFDLIYANDFFPDVDAASRLGNKLSVPVVGVCVGIDVNLTAYSSTTLTKHFKKIADSISGIISRGEGVADKVLQLTGKKSLCVYGVVDTDSYSPPPCKTPVQKQLDLNNNSRYLLYAGYLDRRKGLYELIEAFSQIKKEHRDVKLILCGDGPERQGLIDLATEKGIIDSLVMPGMVEPEQMHKWMQASNLFVLPSYSEGMPNVLMEAMACGVPIVATHVGGIPKATENCKGVMLVPLKNVDALAQAITKMLTSSPTDIQLMSKSVRNRAKERFGVKENAKKILNFLKEIKDTTP